MKAGQPQGRLLPVFRPTVLGTTGLVLISILLVLCLHWPYEMLAARANQMTASQGLAPGIDVTLIIAGLLDHLPGITSIAATLTASFAALPFGIMLVLTTRHGEGLTGAMIVNANPLALALYLGGAGWAVPGLYGLWRLLADLPGREPHQGMPLAGIGIGSAFLLVPHFSTALMPLAAVLFLVAPRTMLGRHMRVFYVLSFAPVAMIAFSLAYCDWVLGGHFVSLPVTSGPAMMVGIALFTLAVAPGLVAGIWAPGGAPRAVVLFVCAYLIVEGTTPAPLILAMAAIGQGAVRLPHREPKAVTLASALGTGAVVVALDYWGLAVR